MKSSLTIGALRWAGALLACVGVAGGACSDTGGDRPSPVVVEGYKAGLAGEVIVQGAGALIELPDVDPSVALTSDSSAGGLVPVRSGSLLPVSISFDAPNANVVAAGIGFSDGGQILTVPMPSMMGQTSGTLAFSVQFPDDFCRNLGSTCHSITCYEYAITSEGKVSAANIVDMAAACGECTEPSCAGLLPDCPSSFPPVSVPTACTGPNGAALPAGDILFSDTDAQELQVRGDSLYWVGGNDLYEASKDASAVPSPLISADGFSVTSFAFLGDSVYVASFSDGVRQYSIRGDLQSGIDALGDTLVSDGDSLYVYDDSVFCEPDEPAGDDDGIRRIDAAGEVTVIDDTARCIRAVAAGGGYVYWLEGEEGDGVLFRAPKQGGAAKTRVPLDAEDWSDLWWAEGYLFAAGFSGIERSLPDGPTPEDLSTGLTLLALDAAGTAVFINLDSTGSCIVSASGGGDVVPVASIDISMAIPGSMAADADYVYYTDNFLTLGTVQNIRRAPRAR